MVTEPVRERDMSTATIRSARDRGLPSARSGRRRLPFGTLVLSAVLHVWRSARGRHRRAQTSLSEDVLVTRPRRRRGGVRPQGAERPDLAAAPMT